MLQGDTVKDDSGAFAVFTEQGPSASQVSAATVDVIAGLPDCRGQAADAVSASQVKMEDPDRSEFQSQHVQTFEDVFHDTSGLNHGPDTEDPVVLPERNLYGHPLAGRLWGSSRKFCWNLDGKKYRIGNVYFFIENKGYFLSVYVNDIKMAGKKQNMAPRWKTLMKNVDFEEPTSLP